MSATVRRERVYRERDVRSDGILRLDRPASIRSSAIRRAVPRRSGADRRYSSVSTYWEATASETTNCARGRTSSNDRREAPHANRFFFDVARWLLFGDRTSAVDGGRRGHEGAVMPETRAAEAHELSVLRCTVFQIGCRQPSDKEVNHDRSRLYIPQSYSSVHV